ncbi:hypothetical protein SO802_009108 [Lithocarpus litseifolius]|uniref:Uncharacterized protein n=1 Tax=Lithocarpus litseifolius TaxID=425828 RepID=A0AAW2DES5_9ROSI
MPTSYAEETILDISLLEPNWDPNCCIYKVPKRLRNVKNAAYTPKLILLGPVHHNREEPEDTKIMETLKKRYFKKFFSRTKKIQEYFEKIVEKNKDKVRHCYAEEITLPEGKNFVDMILLDSIFIIELFLRSTDAEEEEKDYILSKPWLKDGMRQDLIFFILDELYQDFAKSVGIQTSFLVLAYNKTEDLFRNLMALEQCHYPKEAYICNYILLLDFLINNKDDVELLVEEGIIVNSFGSNEAVAEMVNKLGHEIVEVNSYYHDVAEDLNSYYRNLWNQNMASLKTVYFRDIWRGTATVVGIIILVVTIMNFLRPFVFKHI